MNKVCLMCPRCKEVFEAEQADAYECPKCGTSLNPNNDIDEQEKTQIFKV